MMTMPAVLEIEFTAALKVMAFGIRADKAAFLVHEFEAADGAVLPPTVFVFWGRFRRGQLTFLPADGAHDRCCRA